MATAALFLLLAAAALVARVSGQDCTNAPLHSFLCGPGNMLGECTSQGWQPLLTCPAGQVCPAGGNQCKTDTPGPDQCSRNYCYNTDGVFPDLTDCTHYQNCSLNTEESICMRCQAGYAFDACTHSCTKRLGSGGCPSHSASCVKPGDVGTAPGNDRLYYICGADGKPHWSQCSSGFFSVATSSCTSWDVAGCTPCRCAGLTSLPGTDCAYLACKSGGSWEERRCQAGSHFSSSRKCCVSGKCREA